MTGGNRGIGLAIVQALADKGIATLMGSRDKAKGEAAKESLVGEAAKALVTVVQLDVGSESSITAAVADVSAALAGKPLDGLINNAGGMPTGAQPSMGFTTFEHFKGVMELNYLHSCVHVTEAFLPILDTESGAGRVVHVASGAAPTFVSKCSAARMATLCDWSTTSKEGLAAMYDESMTIAAGSGGDVAAVKSAFEAAGLSDGAPYHLSKAMMNGYTQVMAKAYPKLIVNSCSPGFIETDLTRPFAAGAGKTPAEMGMKPVEHGAKCPVFLMTAELPASGWYWGSDCERSPMDKYRSPGDPPYTGGESQDSAANFLDLTKK